MISAASSMTVARRLSFAVVLVALGVVPRFASADDVKADALFKEGRALLDQKKYDEACPKLAEAHTAAPGAGNLLALALCHEGQGKTATAHRELAEAAALGRKIGRADLAKAAEKRAAAMEPTLSKLLVRLPEASSDYEIRLDGRAVAREALAAPIALDPGEHQAEVSAAGKSPRSYVARLRGAGTVEIVVDKLDDAEKPAPAAAPAPEKAGEKPAAALAPMAKVDVEPPPASGGSGGSRGGVQRAIGLTLGGLGIAGLAVGGYFGGRAVSEHNDAGRPGADAQSANDRSKDSVRVAVISATAGFAAIGVGTIVYFTAPSGSSSSNAQTKLTRAAARIAPDVGPTQIGMGVVGTF